MGGSGGDSRCVGDAAGHPAAVVALELQWRPTPEPGAGFGPLPGPG